MKLEVQIKKHLEHIMLDVDFCAKDEIFALLGRSGAGKSMTLKCIAGIEKPDEGRIVLDDTVLFDSERKINLAPQRRRVGYLFQEYALFPHMTVEQNIDVVINDRNKTEELLLKYDIEDIRRQYPGEISGGQKQRVAIARMMAGNPKVILLDEPFAALDCYRKDEVIRNTEKQLRESGILTLLVTHQIDEVGRMAQTVACLNEGHLEKPQKAVDFFRHPQTRTAAMLLGCKNVAEAKLIENRLFLPDWGIDFPQREHCRFIGIREDSFSVCYQDGMYCLPVERMEIHEDVLWFHIDFFCRKESLKPLYCRFPKGRYQKQQLERMKEIYVNLSDMFFLAE